MLKNFRQISSLLVNPGYIVLGQGSVEVDGIHREVNVVQPAMSKDGKTCGLVIILVSLEGNDDSLRFFRTAFGGRAPTEGSILWHDNKVALPHAVADI